MTKKYQKLTLRIDDELHQRLTSMLDEVSEYQHRQISKNYIVQEAIRWVCEEYERDRNDKRQPTFNLFVKQHLSGRRQDGGR